MQPVHGVDLPGRDRCIGFGGQAHLADLDASHGDQRRATGNAASLDKSRPGSARHRGQRTGIGDGDRRDAVQIATRSTAGECGAAGHADDAVGIGTRYARHAGGERSRGHLIVRAGARQGTAGQQPIRGHDRLRSRHVGPRREGGHKVRVVGGGQRFKRVRRLPGFIAYDRLSHLNRPLQVRDCLRMGFRAGTRNAHSESRLLRWLCLHRPLL